jgi:hypothetical protein
MLLCLLQTSSAASVWHDPITWATIVIAVATIWYVITTTRLLNTTVENTRITKEMFEAAHRPYMHISKITAAPNKEGRLLSVDCRLKNAGSIPANDAMFSMRVVVNERSLAVRKPERNMSCVFPQSHDYLVFTIQGEEIAKVFGGARLDLSISIKYKGIANKEYECNYEIMYDADDNTFVPLQVKST